MSTLPQFPLNYLGTNSKNPANVLSGTIPPNVHDIHHNIGTIYINTSNQDIYFLTSLAGGVATWQLVTTGGGSSLPPISKYVVDLNGGTPYATIQSALDAANAAAVGPTTVYVRPGTYIENLTLYNAVDIVGATYQDPLAGEVSIQGTHTISGNSIIGFSNVQLVATGTDSIISTIAAIEFVPIFSGCTFNINDGYVINAPNAVNGQCIFISCIDGSNSNGIINNSAGTMSCVVGFGSMGNFGSNVLTMNNGNLILFNSNVSTNIDFLGSGALELTSTQLSGRIQLEGTSNATIVNSFIDSQAAASAALIQNSSGLFGVSNSVIASPVDPAVEGTGVGEMGLTGVTFLFGNHGIANTLNISPNINFKVSILELWNGVQVISGGVDPNGSLTAAQGSLYLNTAGNSTTTRAYINTDGGTTWTSITTAA
jgi:hypothetical protein